MKRSALILSAIMVVLLSVAVTAVMAADDRVPGAVYKEGPVTGKMIDAGFLYGDSNYHGIIQASDGNVYYVICSHNKAAGARMFRYNPKSGEVKMLGDLTDVVGEDRTKVINQGKVHGDIYEVNGKLYFGTHAGAYDRTYPGGHFMSYDLKTEKFEDFGIGAPHQGLVAMSMDTKRMRMYAISWPGYNFLYCDVKSRKIEKWEEAYAPVIMQGPRSIGIDPRTGNAYWHNMDDTIACFNYEKNVVETLSGPKFDAPMFHIPLDKSVGCVWRSIRWSESMGRFYGIMYYSDWLFSFEPKTADLEILDRIASAPNRKTGKTTYSSLAFELSRDGNVVYYIAPSEALKPDGTTDTELHLVTYDIPLRRYVDHGAITLDDGRKPRYCQGLEVGTDGNLYIAAWIPFTDVSSEKGKKMIEIATGGKPALEIERSKNLQEINLIAIKNPYSR
ncbi:hypothetical protein LLG96_05000 [bacterium]|nr:hypothetical protein [bacterium]